MHGAVGREAGVGMHGDRTGELLLLTGPMFAGKSSSLIAHAHAHAGDVLVLKPAFDTRDGAAMISSRDGSRIAAMPVSSWPHAAAGRALVIDEVQFMVAPHYDGDIVEDIRQAVAAGAQVAVGGLDTDYLRRPFAVIERLAAVADRHVSLSARCHICDAPAPWTAKRSETGRLLELGDDDLYQARCDLHWTTPGQSSDTQRTYAPLAGAGGR